MNAPIAILRNSCSQISVVLKGLFLSLVFTVFFIAIVQAQSQSNNKANDSTEPAWVKMIDDPNVNYYVAIQTYTDYWKQHSKPSGEEEEGSEGDQNFKERQRKINKEIKKDKDRKLSEVELKIQNDKVVMKYQVKRFEQWAREVKPFVQEDGRILTDKERMEIWNKQQEEIKKQQK